MSHSLRTWSDGGRLYLTGCTNSLMARVEEEEEEKDQKEEEKVV